MLPFTKQRLYINGQNFFYYDRNSNLESIKNFSRTIHQELKEYLGIQREMRLREIMSEAITNEQKRFDKVKIHRIEMFYDNYVDQILQMMQMLYHENFEQIDVQDEDYFFDLTLEDQFFNKLKSFKQTAIQLEKCFHQSLQLCEDVKAMIQKQIKKEYPLETFSDKLTIKNKK